MQKQRSTLEEAPLSTVVVVKEKMKKFGQKRANEGVAGVVLAEGKSFAKSPFSHPANCTDSERS